MEKLWPSRKVNLVERPEWSDYDTTGELGDRISNAAFETISQLDIHDVVAKAEQVLEFGSYGRPSGRVILRRYQSEALMQAFLRNDPAVEGFRQLVEDSISWAWEKAFLPTENDTQQAADEAIEELAKEWKDWISGYDGLWEVKEYRGVTGQHFMRNLIQSYVDYEQQQDYFDRYLAFNPNKPFITNIITGSPTLSDTLAPQDVLSWNPPLELPEQQMRSEVENFLKSIEEPLIEKTFKFVKQDFESRDPYNRMEWRSMWQKVLKDDPKRVRSVKKELKAFLKNVKLEQETDDA